MALTVTATLCGQIPLVLPRVPGVTARAPAAGGTRATENDALAAAAADLATIPPYDRRYIRYVWVTDAEHESLQSVALAINWVSRGTIPVRPFPVKHGMAVLARLDLRSYAPRDADLEEFCRIWEEFRFDPRFNLLVTRDTLRFALGLIPDQIKHPVKKARDKLVDEDKIFTSRDGQQYRGRWIKEEYEEAVDIKDVDVLRFVSPHLDARLVEALVQGTGSQAPIVNDGYFITRALTTIQDKGVFKVIYGGLYYQLRGIKRGFQRGTDEDNFLAGLGIGNVEQGVVAKKLFDELRSDQRAAVFRSGVTGKPRRIDLFRSLAGRVGESSSIVSFTHDLKDKDIDIGTHPIMNLLDFQDQAREGIFELPNGLNGFVIFNGQGALTDEVPPDVAVDRTIPAPFPTRLQPAIGCIRCHGPENGWRIVTNDVKKLLSGYVDVFDDLSDPNRYKPQSDVIDRLAGLYAGDLEFKALPRARGDYAAAILRSTGPWKASRKAQTDLVRLASARVAQEFAAYNYDAVGAAAVLRDLGRPVAKDAPAELRKLLPPVRVPYDPRNPYPKDPRIAALEMGLTINRPDYDLTYSFITTQVKGAKK